MTYVALRDVEAGEELCHDYAMARTAPYAMECMCGSEQCRGTITHEDWQLDDVQSRYAGWFMPHVQRRIDAQVVERPTASLPPANGMSVGGRGFAG